MKILKRNQARAEIAGKIRALRVAHHWTQADLSKRLGLSQGRFSEIERGQGSFTAEQLLEVLKLFNVPVSHFAVGQNGAGPDLQNALVRLGAAHLHQRADVLPNERFEEAGDAVREALLEAESPRHVTALAPVLVRNIDRINLNKLRARFLDYGLERRWAWVLENTLAALRQELQGGLPHEAAMLYQRAELILGTHLGNASLNRPLGNSDEGLDLLDARILSGNRLEEVQDSASTLSRRWGIASALQVEDFIEALKASRDASLEPPLRPAPPPRKAKPGITPGPHQPPAAHAPQAVPDTAPMRNAGPVSSKSIEMDWD